MDYWTTTGGLALGISISFGLGAIVQLTRWRAAKLAQPIDNAADVDQDALKKERLARDEVKSPKTKLAVMAVCFALYMGVVCNMDRLPSSVKLGDWGTMACSLITLHVAGQFAQIAGVTESALARHSNKETRYKEIIPSLPKVLMTTALALALAALAAFIPFIAPGNNMASMAALTFIAATVPYRTMTQIAGGRITNLSAPLKWRLFGMSAMVVGVLGLATLFFAIVSAFAIVFPGNDSESDPKPKKQEDPAFLKAFMTIMVHAFMSFQFCTLFGSVGGVLLPVYRVDWVLSNKKNAGAVELEDDSSIEREKEIFSETRAVSTEFDELDKKDLGQLVRVPSFARLVRRGQIGHFLAKPVYTTTALVTIIMTLFGCTWMGKRIVEIVKPSGFSDNAGTAIMSNFAALALTPFIVTPVLAIVSGIRGDFNLLFNHRADWGAHSTSQGEGEEAVERLLGSASEGEEDDEKTELIKKDAIVA